MKPKSAIAKGKELEIHICDRIIETGLDTRAKRSPGSGNGTREKSDIDTSVGINGRNLGIEAKNQKTIKLPEWWRQTRKLESLGREPVLVLKLPNERFEGTLAVIYLETFLELLQGQSGGVCDKEHLPESLKWKMKRLKDYAHDLFKEL